MAGEGGLVEGDVLLKLSVAGAPWPIELKPSRGDYEMPDWGEYDVPEEFEAMGYRSPRKRPWPTSSFSGLLVAATIRTLALRGVTAPSGSYSFS